MPTEHVDIPDAELHEPKGVANANAGQHYRADGAGSGDWRWLPHSHCYYDDIGTGTTITAPASYTLVGPVTVGDSNPRYVTHNALGRLTYTGLETVDIQINASIAFKHSAGAGVDCFFQIFKNGAALAGAQGVQTADSANYNHVNLHAHAEDVVATDYFEVWCKCASGNIVVHAMTLELMGRA